MKAVADSLMTNVDFSCISELQPQFPCSDSSVAYRRQRVKTIILILYDSRASKP